MKKELKFLVYLDMLFIILLGVSGSLLGALSDAVYYLAFILPLLVYFLLAARGKLSAQSICVFPNKESLLLTGAIGIPLVAAVFFISMLTSQLFGLFGISDQVEQIEKITASVLLGALVPSVLEELLFRFIPLSVLKDGSRRDAVFFSAILFALSHCNLFQLPYAFFAGVIFAAADILANSIWPSVLMHLLNNTVSVFWIRYGGINPTLFIIILLAAALLVLLVALLLKKDIFKRIISILREKPHQRLTPEVWIFTFITVSITALSLLEAIWN